MQLHNRMGEGHAQRARLQRGKRQAAAPTSGAAEAAVKSSTPAAAPSTPSTTPPPDPPTTTPHTAAPPPATTPSPSVVVVTDTSIKAAPTPSTTSSSSASSTRSTASSTSDRSTRSTTSRTTSVTSSSLSSSSNAFSTGSVLSLAPSSTGSSADNNGPSAGTVVGIVAGSLMGLVVLAALVGMLLKKKWGDQDEDYQNNPFGNDKDFALIPEGSEDNGSSFSRPSPQAQMAAMPPGLSRSGTVLSNGQGYPRSGPSPAPWDHHAQAAAPPPMPSFQPGQVMMYGNERTLSPAPPMAYHPNDRILSPGPPMAYHPNERTLSPAPPMGYHHGYHVQDPYAYQGFGAPGGYPMMQQQQQYPMMAGPIDPHGNVAALERAASTRYGTTSPAPPNVTVPPQAYNQTEPARAPMTLEPLPESDESPVDNVFEKPTIASVPGQARSGTPTNANIQQSYFSHSRDNSMTSYATPDTTQQGLTSGPIQPPRHSLGRLDLTLGFAPNGGDFTTSPQAMATASGSKSDHQGPVSMGMAMSDSHDDYVSKVASRGVGSSGMGKDERAKRTLSVRNGGLDEDDAYGGI